MVLKEYSLLTKPGIIFGNNINAAVGMVLGAQGALNVPLLIITLIGLSCVVGSASIYNNYIDRFCDKKMKRTRHRALAREAVPIKATLLIAMILGLLGITLLAVFANQLTALVALSGFFIYVAIYSFVKYRSTYSTLIGSLAGATPPVIGYCAVTGQLDLKALILFAMIALWQMPHFFAIAIYRLEDYAAAAIPLLPIKKGIKKTKIQMIFYTIAFTATSSLLTFFGYLSSFYLITATALGLCWLYLCLKGLRCNDDKLWARKMFLFSLIVITALCVVIPLSII